MALKFFILFSILVTVSRGSGPIVKIRDGILVGAWKQSQNGRKFASFQGIPYANPPVGEFRFREPQQMRPWAGVWNASSPLSICIQYNPITKIIEGSENCLFLNVATPDLREDALLPVVFFIHGGAFMFGKGNKFDPIYIMDRNMVFVSINYRLGPLGFLATGDQAAPGNEGLKDQAFALRWVKDNIIKFGGDPDCVTLTGQSAGGASVHYHYLSPVSRGLFHRGWAMSGVALNPWTFAMNPLRNAKALAALVGCPTDRTCDLVECLRSRPAEVVVNAQTQMFEWRVNLFSPFIPTMEPVGLKERAFQTEYPYLPTKAGKMAKLPLIVSRVSEEGLYPGAIYPSDPTILPELDSRWAELASYVLEYNDTLPLDRRPAVAAKIRQKYLDGKPISLETFNELVQALGDRLFVADIGKLAQIHAEKSGMPTYQYRYAFRGSASLSNSYAGNDVNYGVSHVDDLGMLFKILPYKNTPQDLQMRKFFVDMLYSYASTGVPKLPNGQIWTPMQPGSPDLIYLNIAGPDDFQMESSSNVGNRTFWDSLGFNENENYNERTREELNNNM